MKASIHIPHLLVLLSGVSYAADLTGAWNTTTRTPDGSKHESVLNLQVQGTKLTGKIVSKRGTVEITNGIGGGEQRLIHRRSGGQRR